MSATEQDIEAYRACALKAIDITIALNNRLEAAEDALALFKATVADLDAENASLRSAVEMAVGTGVEFERDANSLRAALALQAQERQWQPIETVRDKQLVLLAGEFEEEVAVASWRMGWVPSPPFRPTRWMPLPSLPSAAAPVKENP